MIAANERAVLADTVALNEGIEESIKTSRDQYESCQEEIYELGLKEDRVKQSGTKLVQQSTLELQGQRDALLDNITEI